MNHLSAPALLSFLVCGVPLAAAGCRGPASSPAPIALSMDAERFAFELGDGPRAASASSEMEAAAGKAMRALFRSEPMPTTAPAEAAEPAPVAAVERDLPDPGRPEWADGVPRPAVAPEQDLPQDVPVEVRRGETPQLLAQWAGTDVRTILEVNAEQLGKRRSFRAKERVKITMSANQRIAFDQARDAFQTQRVNDYFAQRYFEKVVVYRIKKGDLITTISKRYGQVDPWLLEEFNQINFSAMQPGQEVLIPVVAKFKPGQKNPPALQVVDEAGHPLAEDRRVALAPQIERDVITRARLALDDSNVFERGSDAPIGAAPSALLPDYADVRVAAPAGAATDPSAPAAPEPAAAVTREVIIRPGETLIHYMQWGHITLDAIRAVNPHLDPDRIMVGARLTLPLTDAQFVDFVKGRKAWTDGLADAAATKGAASKAGAGKAGAGKGKGKASKPGRHHVVASGETALRIAKRYKTTLAALRDANGGDGLGHLRIGQKIALP